MYRTLVSSVHNSPTSQRLTVLGMYVFSRQELGVRKTYLTEALWRKPYRPYFWKTWACQPSCSVRLRNCTNSFNSLGIWCFIIWVLSGRLYEILTCQVCWEVYCSKFGLYVWNTLRSEKISSMHGSQFPPKYCLWNNCAIFAVVWLYKMPGR